MSEPDYFKNALSNFTFETACGGAIRHLTDLGYTVNQISEHLAFPTSREQVQKVVWERLLFTGVICLKEPGSGEVIEKTEFVKDYDKYGKASFRKVSLPVSKRDAVFFKESYFDPKNNFSSFLRDNCTQNGQNASYMSCDFGLNAKKFQEQLQLLDEKQQEYLTGLPWIPQLCYHRLDCRMQEILIRLYEKSRYQATCFFLDTKEKVHLS